MFRFARSRRAVARHVVAVGVVLSIATPAAAGDDLIVQGGDTLWDIAQRHGTTVAALAELNGIANPSFILVGQRILLQPPATPPAPPPANPRQSNPGDQ